MLWVRRYKTARMNPGGAAITANSVLYLFFFFCFVLLSLLIPPFDLHHLLNVISYLLFPVWSRIGVGFTYGFFFFLLTLAFALVY